MTRPLRVAMVGNGATVHALVRGGAIAALGHEVRLVTLGPVLDHSPALEVRTREIPRNAVAGLRAFRSFQRDLRDFKPDLLHVHYAGGRLGSLALASGLKPLVVTVMGGDVQPEQHMGRANVLDHRVTRRLLNEADVILAKSDALRRDIARYGEFSDKIETVRWGIETERFLRDEGAAQRTRLRMTLPPGPILLSPRILRPLYNIHLIVEAMVGIARRFPGALLLIVRHREDADYAARIRTRVAELSLSQNVRFIEPVSHDDMPGLLAATQAVVSVPFSDGLPQTLFESLASETPIVLGNLDAYQEMVRHEREVLLAPLDAAGISDAVLRLLQDPALARRLTDTGLARIRAEASLPVEARRVEGFYRRALAAPRRPSPIVPRFMDAASLAFRLS